MLAHPFDRFHVVTKFILPTIRDLKFSTLNFDDKCEYLQGKERKHSAEAKEHILDLMTYYKKIKPYVYFYKQQIMSLNETVHHILKK